MEGRLYVSSDHVRDGLRNLFHQSNRCARVIAAGAGGGKEVSSTRLLVADYRLFRMRRIGTLALSQGIEHYDSLVEDNGAYEDAEGALRQQNTSVRGDAAVSLYILCSVPVYST